MTLVSASSWVLGPSQWLWKLRELSFPALAARLHNRSTPGPIYCCSANRTGMWKISPFSITIGFPCVLFHPSSSHCILSTSSSCVNQHHLKTACCKVMQHIQPLRTFLIACILHLNLPSCSPAMCLFRNTATQILDTWENITLRNNIYFGFHCRVPPVLAKILYLLHLKMSGYIISIGIILKLHVVHLLWQLAKTVLRF